MTNEEEVARLLLENKKLRELITAIELEHWVLLRACVEVESVGRMLEQYGDAFIPNGDPRREYTDRLAGMFFIIKDALKKVRKRTGPTILRNGRLEKNP